MRIKPNNIVSGENDGEIIRCLRKQISAFAQDFTYFSIRMAFA